MSPDFVKQKAREISYALIRVCFYIKRADLRSRLDFLAIELLENSARASVDTLNSENLNKALSTISVLDGLVRLAHSIYEIEPINATLLVRELDGLNTAIRQSGNQTDALGQLPNLENLFSKALVTKEAESVKQNSMPEEIKLSTEVFSEPFKELKEERIVNSNNGNGINTAIRQAAIVNRVKSGNGSGCRLKDLIAEFSDVSERTLRYDLQRLCERGLIERVGNGGPASYYVYRGELPNNGSINISEVKGVKN